MSSDPIWIGLGAVLALLGVILLIQAIKWGPRVGWWKRVPEGPFRGSYSLIQGSANLVVGLGFIGQGIWG